jgi:hypothetical protein
MEDGAVTEKSPAADADRRIGIPDIDGRLIRPRRPHPGNEIVKGHIRVRERIAFDGKCAHVVLLLPAGKA